MTPAGPAPLRGLTWRHVTRYKSNSVQGSFVINRPLSSSYLFHFRWNISFVVGAVQRCNFPNKSNLTYIPYLFIHLVFHFDSFFFNINSILLNFNLILTFRLILDSCQMKFEFEMKWNEFSLLLRPTPPPICIREIRTDHRGPALFFPTRQKSNRYNYANEYADERVIAQDQPPRLSTNHPKQQNKKKCIQKTKNSNWLFHQCASRDAGHVTVFPHFAGRWRAVPDV